MSSDPGLPPLAGEHGGSAQRERLAPAGLPVRLESDAALAAAAARWLAAPVLGLDTEFVRERTFFPRLGLIQVTDGAAVYLLDPLAVRDLAPLREVCAAAGTLKVLHSASEDVEVFHRAVGAVPSPMFDTQVAAGLAGIGASLSYQRLVAALLNIDLPKGETRTDWLARPLSTAQISYAAEDVACLLPLYAILRRELEQSGRLDWALEDSAALLDTSRFDADPGRAYRRLRGGGRLNRRQLGVLRELAAWRDGEARRRDLPRGFVLRDETLLQLAIRQPTTAEDLRLAAGAAAPLAVRQAATLLGLIAAALARDAADLPPEAWRPPGSQAVRDLDRRLRDVVRERAAALGLPPELLAPRRTLDALLRSALTDAEPRLPSDLGGWRREVIGVALLRAATTAA
jgi:ribonuclease D